MNRRSFVGTLALTLTSLAFGLKPKAIKPGAIFTNEELHLDKRFMTEEDLGVSLNTSKFFKFREHSKHSDWKLGVIVDTGKYWVPYYATPTRALNKICFKLSACPEDVDAEVSSLRDIHAQKTTSYLD